VITPGELTLRLEQSLVPMSVTHVADCPDLGPECFDGGPPPTPYEHHVDQVIAETVLDASLGLTPWLGVDARWSLRVADVNPTYTELDGSPKEVPDDIHHHDETLVDLTDPWITGRFAASSGPLVSVARLGVTLPVGRIEPDPYRLGRRGQSHEHLQAGTGTVVPIVGFGLSYALTPLTLGLGGIGFFNAAENDEGFRAPVRVYGSQRTSLALADGDVTPFVEITLAHEGEEYWHGTPGLEGSNVRTEIYLGGGASWRFVEGWSVEATARARIATLTDAPAFKSYGLFSLALSTSFDLWEADAERAAPASSHEGPTIRERHEGGVTEFEKK
jgi:hypothetical protein